MTLSPTKKKFILHWGEMGTRWGVNRTVAQIHALLYLSAEPLTAEEIARILSVARSNVSTSLRELQSWGIVRPVHVLGDRRAHFESMTDVWQMFQVILDERKRREVDPTVAVLKECLEETGSDSSSHRLTRERLEEMLEFFKTMTTCYEDIRRLPAGALRSVASARGKVISILTGRRKQ